jgi:hypothetical protein
MTQINFLFELMSARFIARTLAFGRICRKKAGVRLR